MGQELAAARQYYDQKRRELGLDAPETLQALDEWAALHLDRDEPADAEPLFRQGLERKLRVFGEEHPATIASLKNLARVLKQQKKLADAEKLLRQCLEIHRRVQGPEHPDVIVAMDELADILEEQGKHDQADSFLRQCLEGWDRLLGYAHSETQAAARKLVFKLQAHGKPVDLGRSGPAAGYVCAEMGLWKEAVAGFAKAFESDLPKEPNLWSDYACLLVQTGDTEGYRRLCGRLLERFYQSNNEDDIAFLSHTVALAPKALPEAAPILELAQRRVAKVAPGSGHYIWSGHVLALGYYRAGRFDKAAECLEGLLKGRPHGDHDVANWLLKAMVEQRLSHDENAQKWLDKANQWIQRAAATSAPLPPTFWRQWLMIQFLQREAEALLRDKNVDQPQRKSDKPKTNAQKKPRWKGIPVLAATVNFPAS